MTIQIGPHELFVRFERPTFKTGYFGLFSFSWCFGDPVWKLDFEVLNLYISFTWHGRVR